MKLAQQIKMVCTDLDSTLVAPSANTVSPANRDALLAAKALNMIIVIVTARNFAKAIGVAHQVQADFLIATTGSVIYDLRTDQFIYQKNINPAAVQSVIETARHFPEVSGCFYSMKSTPAEPVLYAINGQSKQDEIEIQNTIAPRMPLIHISPTSHSLPTFPCLHILLIGELEQLKQMQTQLQDIPQLEIICCNYNRLMELNPANVNKAESTKWLARRLNIDVQTEIMAFGDGPNDLSLINMTKYGVAMDNATDMLKQQAFFVTGTQEANGVAQALKKWILS